MPHPLHHRDVGNTSITSPTTSVDNLKHSWGTAACDVSASFERADAAQAALLEKRRVGLSRWERDAA